MSGMMPNKCTKQFVFNRRSWKRAVKFFITRDRLLSRNQSHLFFAHFPPVCCFNELRWQKKVLLSPHHHQSVIRENCLSFGHLVPWVDSINVLWLSEEVDHLYNSYLQEMYLSRVCLSVHTCSIKHTLEVRPLSVVRWEEMLISITAYLIRRLFLILSKLRERKSVSLTSWRLTSSPVQGTEVSFIVFSAGMEVGPYQWKQQTCTVCVRWHGSAANVKTGLGNPFPARPRHGANVTVQPPLLIRRNYPSLPWKRRAKGGNCWRMSQWKCGARARLDWRLIGVFI